MKIRKIQSGKPNANGLQAKTKKFYGVFVDSNKRVRRIPLSMNRRSAVSLARTVDQLVSLSSSGDPLPPDVVRAVDLMPATMRRRLAKWKILGSEREAAGRTLLDHIAEWAEALAAKGGTAAHVRQSADRVRGIFKAAGFTYWSEVNASRLSIALASMRETGAEKTVQASGKVYRRVIHAQTSNYYLQAAKQFCRWMVRDERATRSPLESLEPMNVRVDRCHDRRELTTEELQTLIGATTAGPDRYGMTGEARAMLYRLAAETGLRAGELRSLTRASFTLDGKEPAVTIAAAYAKNRRQDRLPLRPATAAALAEFLRAKLPAAPAFTLPRRFAIASMFRADLLDARTWRQQRQTGATAAIDPSDEFLSYRDSTGRVIDFHALRHTFISNLAAAGVHPKTAQRLARHSTITLTMDRYTHLRREDLAAAVGELPDLGTPGPEQNVATGTAGAVVERHPASGNLSVDLSVDGGILRNTPERGGTKIGRGRLTESLGKTESNRDVCTGNNPLSPVGLEPTTYGLKVRCSTN